MSTQTKTKTEIGIETLTSGGDTYVVEANPNSYETHGEESLRQRILFILMKHPRITPTMLCVGLGNPPVGKWKPLLNQLVLEGVIFREYDIVLHPNGRTYNNTVYKLARRVAFHLPDGAVINQMFTAEPVI